MAFIDPPPHVHWGATDEKNNKSLMFFLFLMKKFHNFKVHIFIALHVSEFRVRFSTSRLILHHK